MNTIQDRIRGSLIGVAGLIGLIGLTIYIFLNLATIMLTPRSSGCGEYYDQQQGQDVGTNWTGILFIMIPLLVLFYPWFKWVISKIFSHPREVYFGLFPGDTKFFKIVAIVLSFINMLTIIWLSFVSEAEASTITNWDSLHAVCPENSMFFTEYLLEIFAFWGLIDLLYEIYVFYAKRKQNIEVRVR